MVIEMSKKRLVVGIILNFILFLVILRGLRLTLTMKNLVDSLRYAEIICPIILIFVVIIYLLALFHALISGNKTWKLIEGIRLIFISAEIVIGIIELAILMPYRGRFDLEGIAIYKFIAIPLMSLITVFATKRKYSLFALLYGILGSAGYLGTIITLMYLDKVESPYKFIDFINQETYKMVINVIVILGINSIVCGIIMLLTKTKRVEKNLSV